MTAVGQKQPIMIGSILTIKRRVLGAKQSVANRGPIQEVVIDTISRKTDVANAPRPSLNARAT